MKGVITQKQEVNALRFELHEGREHLVAPVIAIVGGVLNDALVTQEEFGKFVQAWNGIPVPVLHPQKNGRPVSANSPDIIEQTIGRFYNAKIDENRLMGEIWIDVKKAEKLGFGDIVKSMVSGDMFEVSTGYFSDDEPRSGTLDGEPYNTVHRNIRPDHLAILVGQEGACSIGDGCGVPRLNEGMFQKAFVTFCKTIGLQDSRREDEMQLSKEHVKLATVLAVQCKDVKFTSVDQVISEAEKSVKANEGITPKQLQLVMDMDEGGREIMLAFLQALQEVGGDAEPPKAPTPPAGADEHGEEEERLLMQAKKSGLITKDEIAELIANGVKDGMLRVGVTQKLLANEKCPFDEDELKAMSVEHLDKLEKSIRSVDYSGRGGFGDPGSGDNVEPMQLHSGVMTPKKKDESKAA